MTEVTVTIKNRAGIHARPSALLVQAATRFASHIWLEKAGDRINAKSIMGIITLGACYGTPIKIIADGPDEVQATRVIENLFNSGFEEELGA
ncbi:MAG: HPr family phosphocarrier protein [Rectinemataceae bacterium]|nr:HPr family phosphocarrier protein [Rectinemataceae bacterium]